MGLISLPLLLLLILQASGERMTLDDNLQNGSWEEDSVQQAGLEDQLHKRPQEEDSVKQAGLENRLSLLDSFEQIDPIFRCFLLSVDQPLTEKAFHEPVTARKRFCYDYMMGSIWHHYRWEGSSLQKYYSCRNETRASNMTSFDIPFAIVEVRKDLACLCDDLPNLPLKENIFISPFRFSVSTALEEIKSYMLVRIGNGTAMLGSIKERLQDMKEVDMKECDELLDWMTGAAQRQKSLREKTETDASVCYELYWDVFYNFGFLSSDLQFLCMLFGIFWALRRY